MPATSETAALRQRFLPLAWFGLCFLAIASAVRLLLLAKAGAGVPHTPPNLLYIFGVGLGYDLATFVYVAWPMVLFLWLVPTRDGARGRWARWGLYAAALLALCLAALGALHLLYQATLKQTWPVLLLFLYLLPLAAFTYASRAGQRVLYAFGYLALFFLLFVGTAEWVFWDEFGTRFNFIAVDYLVYTDEVVGNIEQSYPMARWLSLMALAAAGLLLLTRRGLRARDDGSRWTGRSLVALGWAAATVLVTVAVNADMKDRFENPYINALAGNGIYQFFAAFRGNRLDYRGFYPALPQDKAYAVLRRELATPDATFIGAGPRDLAREIRNAGPEKHLNVVLISVESLSGSYLAHFGNTKGLTPNLDALADQGLFYTRLYANGTRTVRGLEALALSVPPTPGDSLVRQPGNEGLFSLADVFDVRGYASEFVYGGFGYFDNMDYFFAHNGYAAVDRDAIPKDMPIHGENVWGVSDEDLFTLAMRRMDAIHASGRPFFLHVMTTSNHRPYTFPAGRVDAPQGHRLGAVKYTDWALGDFIRRMREKPYFDDTVFVITADHCADSAGDTAIPVDKYHIPLIVYAPKHFQPRRIDTLMAQIDIPPTLLGLLDFSYRSRFFGRDIARVPAGDGHAFPSTYQKLGFLQEDRLTILYPPERAEQVRPDFATGGATPLPADEAALEQAIAAYQVAAESFRDGGMRWRKEDGTPVAPADGTQAAPTPQHRRNRDDTDAH
ncbi:LTA synthase family protein [Fulvimonas soli]|uniref:Phosphoglycerol transferase MdoB-like AlkP superfamily enzyme n=1 Tax=Fulvimonas soli TaxID=155197 RepID=A0A316J064_9GAMM|nr:LTA synthase family protein [Fulvimonas soli]PWK92895.1 phosphoglycerol transferase MdoB-like AlkP superfamily enzyme [Fulvimonas soli]TNY26614.1 sulfatase [Fulvimonas soli]